MEIYVRAGESSQYIDVNESETILAALQKVGIVIDAPCGGRGTCLKCRVLVRDEGGVEYKLACQTPVSDGMEVVLERSRPMEVSTQGASRTWKLAEGAWGYGVSIDVGTTTVVCRLYNLETGELLGARGRSNPQLVFGADVITRIDACEEGNLKTMADLLGDTLMGLVSSLADDADIDLSQITAVVLAGNTVMEHIAANISPLSIGIAPYKPFTLFGEDIEYLALEKSSIAAGEAYFAPCVAGYVGGDITCGILAVQMMSAHRPVLFLDLGTNGEMALGDENGIVTCATAAGPVFEGANIKYGMPAYPGAISQVAYEDGELKLTVIGDEEPTGVCGTGLIDAVSLLVEHGLVNIGGRIIDDDSIDPEQADGLEKFLIEEDDARALRLTENISITQKDVRSLQLAKAAIAAGILTLMKEKGLSFFDIERLDIAGGFGEYLNLHHAATVGIIPHELEDRASSVGNTCIEGASAVLLSDDANNELDRIMEACTYIELSGDLSFNQFYVDCMLFEQVL